MSYCNMKFCVSRYVPGLALTYLLSAFPTVVWSADLLSFCLGPAPTDAGLLSVYTSQCPSYLQSQFATPGIVAQNTDKTTAIAQEQTQVAILTALSALTKPPPVQVPSGMDISALGAAALKKDAEVTYRIAIKIGKKIDAHLKDDEQALIVNANDLTALLSVPVDSETVKGALDDYTTRISSLRCSNAAAPAAAAVPPLALGIFGAQALLSTLATGASMFQPNLVAAAKTSGVTDPQNIMVAGVINGAIEGKRKYLHTHVPVISSTNDVLVALGTLRMTVVAANQRISLCQANDVAVKPATSLINDAKEFIANLLKTDGTKPSLLDSAARRSALKGAKISYTLLLSRDVSGGGIAAVKPNWFRSTVLLSGTADGISYRLEGLDGVVKDAGFISDWSADRCDLDEWTQSFTSCPQIKRVEMQNDEGAFKN